MSSKKITNVGGEDAPQGSGAVFTVSPESKAKAKSLRLYAMLAWIVAIGLQVFTILKLIHNDMLIYMIIAIVVLLGLSILGSTLWKKANRLDPASEKDKVRFFIQNQLGAIMGVLAFLPLVIMILTNKELDGKTKGIAGGLAAIAMIIAGISGADFNPPSLEQYAEQTAEVERLNEGRNFVYWTKFGSSYHLFSDCSYINTDRTSEIFEGSVAQARELKNISNLCSRCRNKAMKERNLTEEDLKQDTKDSEELE